MHIGSLFSLSGPEIPKGKARQGAPGFIFPSL